MSKSQSPLTRRSILATSTYALAALLGGHRAVKGLMADEDGDLGLNAETPAISPPRASQAVANLSFDVSINDLVFHLEIDTPVAQWDFDVSALTSLKGKRNTQAFGDIPPGHLIFDEFIHEPHWTNRMVQSKDGMMPTACHGLYRARLKDCGIWESAEDGDFDLLAFSENVGEGRCVKFECKVTAKSLVTGKPEVLTELVQEISPAAIMWVAN